MQNAKLIKIAQCDIIDHKEYPTNCVLKAKGFKTVNTRISLV